MWRRLPAYLPNIQLKLLPLSEAQQQVFEKTGFLKEIAFKTAPSVSKVSLPTAAASPSPLLFSCPASGTCGCCSAGQVDIKHFLESVYGLNVAKVNTLNVEGKKKRGKHGFFR